MRDVVFKNLTRDDKRRKIISTSEVVDKAGVRSIIRRHFVCIVKEIPENKMQQPLSSVYVLKEHNNKEQREKFFCRLKGSIHAVNNGKLFLILFTHSLKIILTVVPKDLVKHVG